MIADRLFLNRYTSNSNVQNALANFFLWLSWYPGDYAGAVEFSGCYLDTPQEVNEFQACLEKIKEETK
jgi:hypothetical protein